MASIPLFLTTTSIIPHLGEQACHSQLRCNLGWSLSLLDQGTCTIVWDGGNEVVLNALAREALLLHSLGKSYPADWPAEITGAYPIQGCQQTLSSLIQDDWMPALFPIDHGPGRAETGIVWCSRERRIIEPPAVSGDSWQLAAGLADFVIKKPKGALAARRRLALEFIASGCVNDGAVGAVNKGCKSELKIPGRIWLVPSVGWENDENTINVGTLADACAIIADELTLNEEDKEDWPDPVMDFHCFVGGAIMPVIEGILCARPTTVHLWVSDWAESRPNAEWVKAFFESTLPEPFEDYAPKVVFHSVVSNNISAIEQQLRIVLLGGGDSTPAVFSITTGNRLQALAALNMMRLLCSQSGCLVYKDISHKVFGEWAVIRYDTYGTCARTGILSSGDRLRNFSQDVFSHYRELISSLDDLRSKCIREIE
jgi:hypothetical protein